MQIDMIINMQMKNKYANVTQSKLS